ncbi:hypothetical protein [Streptomyces anulatus]|uniref:hypothetical protein n=1 Tax=Streptomyces anulatus TaxID=1892 RepID=UPI003D818248
MPIPAAATTVIGPLRAASRAFFPFRATSRSWSVTPKTPASPSYGDVPASFFTWTASSNGIGSSP